MCCRCIPFYGACSSVVSSLIGLIKDISVFRVTQPYLLLVKPRCFRFSGEKIILCILEGSPVTQNTFIFYVVLVFLKDKTT